MKRLLSYKNWQIIPFTANKIPAAAMLQTPILVLAHGIHVLGILLLSLLSTSASVWAHESSYSYLILDWNPHPPTLRWDIRLKDLDHALGLDLDDDGAITWGEVKARSSVIVAYTGDRLAIQRGAKACSLGFQKQQINQRDNNAYLVLEYTVHCPITIGSLQLDYQLFFDIDPSHRGLLETRHPKTTKTTELSPNQTRIELNPVGNHKFWPTLGWLMALGLLIMGYRGWRRMVTKYKDFWRMPKVTDQ